MSACPCPARPNRLLRLLADELPEPEQAELVAHLDGCPECRRTLESLAARSGLWKDLSLLRDDEFDQPTGDPGKGNDPELAEDDEVPTGLLRALRRAGPARQAGII